jgi:hypothetical protein
MSILCLLAKCQLAKWFLIKSKIYVWPNVFRRKDFLPVKIVLGEKFEFFFAKTEAKVDSESFKFFAKF